MQSKLNCPVTVRNQDITAAADTACCCWSAAPPCIATPLLPLAAPEGLCLKHHGAVATSLHERVDSISHSNTPCVEHCGIPAKEHVVCPGLVVFSIAQSLATPAQGTAQQGCIVW